MTESIEYYYQKYYYLFVSYVHKYLNDFDLSEDIVQDLFTKFIEKGVLINNKNTALSFFFSSLRNLCYDVLNNKHYHVQPCSHEEIEELDDIELNNNFYSDCESLYICGAVIQTIHEVINDFENIMSSVVVDTYIHNTSKATIAKTFNITRYQVDQNLKKASIDFKQKLKSLITENFSDFFQQYGELNPYTL